MQAGCRIHSHRSVGGLCPAASVQLARFSRCAALGHAMKQQHMPTASGLGLGSSGHVVRHIRGVHASAASTTSSPPALVPLNDDYERCATFGDFANWLLPGSVMVGRYPYCEKSRCTSKAKGELQLTKIIETGISTFVCLQAEIPAQSQLSLAGKDGFLPYRSTAELIKSSQSPPPGMETMMGLRNPTLNKFLPDKKRAPPSYQSQAPSYTLDFMHFPIVDLSVPSAAELATLVQDLADRVIKGEKIYIHCWGGRGRAGTVGACLLGKLYGLSADEAIARVQRAFITRGDTKYDRSPETDEQHALVRSYISSLNN